MIKLVQINWNKGISKRNELGFFLRTKTCINYNTGCSYMYLRSAAWTKFTGDTRNWQNLGEAFARSGNRAADDDDDDDCDWWSRHVHPVWQWSLSADFFFSDNCAVDAHTHKENIVINRFTAAYKLTISLDNNGVHTLGITTSPECSTSTTNHQYRHRDQAWPWKHDQQEWIFLNAKINVRGSPIQLCLWKAPKATLTVKGITLYVKIVL